MQVFLLGRQLRAVWGTVRCPPAVGSAQQHHHQEDPCSLRYSSSSHQVTCFVKLFTFKFLLYSFMILSITDQIEGWKINNGVLMQVLLQPCGWMNCAPRWSRVERTDRPSSGGSRVKLCTTIIIKWGDWSFPVSHIGQQRPSILYTEQKTDCNHTVSWSSWRDVMT